MVVLLDVGRQLIPVKPHKEFNKLCGKPRCAVAKRPRILRIAAAKGDFTSQIAKSSSTWPESISSFFQVTRQNESQRSKEIDFISGNGGNNLPPQVRGYGEDGDGSESTEHESAELLNLAEAESLAAEKGVQLPGDFVKAAKTTGLRATTLHKFLDLQSAALIGFLVRMFPWIRDRLIEDPAYLFKVLTEVTIDTGCATLAELRKRGADFFDEFEFYLSDMIVGLVLDVALVSLLAPVAVVGAKPASAAQTGLRKYIAKLPNALFEANIKGLREYSMSQRVISFFYKAAQYAVIGFACGFVGQGMANSLMHLRRYLAGGATASDVAVPPLIKSAFVWALFMGVSSNTRYQTVVGLERLVDVSIAKRIPQIAYVTTIIIRFINNVVGGENFIDMARWAGIQ